MNIVTTIKGFVNQLSAAPSFRYADVYEENSQDNLTYPHVQLLEVETGEFIMNAETGGMFDRPNLFIRFLDTTQLDDFAEQRDVIVEQMKVMAREFIKRINKSGDFDWIERVRWMEVVNAYDTNVSGVEINFQLKPIKPGGFCL